MKKNIVFLLLLTFLFGFLYAQPDTLRVCYNSSVNISLPNYVDSCSYYWEITFSSTDDTIVQDLDSNYLLVDSVFCITYVRCYSKCISVEDSLCYEALVIPYSLFTSGTIEGGDTICYNASSGTLYLSENCIGGVEPYSYQWEYSDNGEQWELVSSAITPSYQPQSLQNSTYYRLKFISSEGCGVVYSNVESVHVYDKLQAVTISSDSSTYCYNAIPEPLYIENQAVGADGNYINQWQISLNNEDWSDIIGEIGDTYQPTSLIQTTYFRVKTISPLCSDTVFSHPFKITVYSMIHAGEIRCDDNFVCYNSTAQLDFISQPVGGGGSYSYRWQIASDSINFIDIQGASSINYETDSLTSQQIYRVIVSSTLGCAQDTTNELTINVRQPFVPGTIIGNDTVCYDAIPGQLSLETSCYGGETPYSYQWYRSTREYGSRDVLIPQAVDSIYQSDNLKQTTSYKLKFFSAGGCGEAFSNTIVVHVYDSLTPAVISTDNESPICYGTEPDELFILTPPTGADGVFAHQWQTAADGFSWVDVNNANGSSYQHVEMYNDLYFRLVDTSGFGCGVVVSNPILVTVYDQLDAGVLSGNDSICYAMSANLTMASQPTGGGNSYSYQWIVQTNSGVDSVLVDANESSLHCDSLLQTTFYRLVVSSNLGCGQDTTDWVSINVRAPFVAGSISGPDSSCYNFRPDSLIVVNNCIGGSAPYFYQWQRFDNSLWVDIVGADDVVFQDNEITEMQSYRLQFTSSNNCGITYSNPIQVAVRDMMQPAIIYTNSDSIICYNSAPQPLGILIPATGGGNQYAYQWQSSLDGENWSNLENATDTICQFPNITQATYYRLTNSSLLGCGMVTSDPIVISVYDEIDAGIIGNHDTICYMADATINYISTPSGGGDSYSFQWLASSDGITFNPISTSNSDTLYDDSLTTTMYYKMLVTSNLGCSQDTSNEVQIFVRDSFVVGAISLADTVCFNSLPDPLKIITNCSGGAMPYSYQWQIFDSWEEDWVNIEGATDSIYQPDTISQLTNYRLQFTSAQNCGLGYADSTWIDVIARPIVKEISGDDVVCLNQYDVTYFLPTIDTNLNYFWNVEGGEITVQPNPTTILVHWDDTTDTGKIILTLAITESCANTLSFPIQKSDSYAPDRTQITRKGNSNVLICAENSETITYQWGFVEKSSNWETIIPNSDFPYVQIPHNIDTTIYAYFVQTQYQGENCATRTYYVEEQTTQIEEEYVPLKVYPNPTHNELFVDVNGVFNSDFYISIYNSLGKHNYTQRFNAVDIHTTVHLNVSLDPGLYFIHVTDGECMFVNKIIVK